MKYAPILLMILALTACNEQTVSKAQDFEMQVFEIEHIDGYKAQTFVIEDSTPVDTYDSFERHRLDRERLDYIAVQRKVAENGGSFAQTEEERILDYCREYGFESCMDIDRTCEEDGCHRVKITCDEDFDDEPNSCTGFSVDVMEYIDNDLTAQSDEEIVKDGKCISC